MKATVLMYATLPGAYQITLEQHAGSGTYEVRYGKHVRIFAGFPAALCEFNECVGHAARAAGLMYLRVNPESA